VDRPPTLTRRWRNWPFAVRERASRPSFLRAQVLRVQRPPRGSAAPPALRGGPPAAGPVRRAGAAGRAAGRAAVPAGAGLPGQVRQPGAPGCADGGGARPGGSHSCLWRAASSQEEAAPPGGHRRRRRGGGVLCRPSGGADRILGGAGRAAGGPRGRRARGRRGRLPGRGAGPSSGPLAVASGRCSCASCSRPSRRGLLGGAASAPTRAPRRASSLPGCCRRCGSRSSWWGFADAAGPRCRPASPQSACLRVLCEASSVCPAESFTFQASTCVFFKLPEIGSQSTRILRMSDVPRSPVHRPFSVYPWSHSLAAPRSKMVGLAFKGHGTLIPHLISITAPTASPHEHRLASASHSRPSRTPSSSP
ncbi:unnamed protein product, partial [Prorocentrum cordatum]